MDNEANLDSTKIVVRQISKSIAKDLIIKNHYTHKWTLCKIAYGVFYKNNIENRFVDGDNETLIGACIYGHPVGRSAAESFSEFIKINQVFELTRLWIEDFRGKNIESYVISQTFKLIKKGFPHIKIILSYADPSQTHVGRIYQALNFIFLGLNSITNLMPNYSISLKGPPNYDWLHSRTVFSMFGSHNVNHLKEKIGHTFYRKKESGKYKYIYILCDKIEKKKILNTLKPKVFSYPKKHEYTEEIEEIKIETIKENTFFT